MASWLTSRLTVSARRAVLGACAMAGAALPVAHAHAQGVDARQVVAKMRKDIRSDAGADAAVAESYGSKLTGEKAVIARETLRAIINARGFDDYMAATLKASGLANAEPSALEAQAVEAVSRLKVIGIAQLPTPRRLAYFAMVADMLRSLPPDRCLGIAQNKLSTLERVALEQSYLANLPLSRFAAVHELWRDGVTAALSQGSTPSALTAEQVNLAQTAYLKASGTRLRANLPPATLRRIDNGDTRLNDSEKCMVYVHGMESLADMPEPYRSWQTTRFLKPSR